MKSRAPCYSNEGTALHIRYYPFMGFSSFTLFQPLCVSDNVFILLKPVVVATISECWEIVFDADTIVGEMQTESLEPVVSMFIGRDDGRRPVNTVVFGMSEFEYGIRGADESVYESCFIPLLALFLLVVCVVISYGGEEEVVAGVLRRCLGKGTEFPCLLVFYPTSCFIVSKFFQLWDAVYPAFVFVAVVNAVIGFFFIESCDMLLFEEPHSTLVKMSAHAPEIVAVPVRVAFPDVPAEFVDVGHMHNVGSWIGIIGFG